MEETLPLARVEVIIQGKPLVFEVDLGALFFFIPMNEFSGIKEYFPPLEPNDIKLNSFTEHLIEVMDMAQVHVSYNEKSCSLPLLIVREGNVNLAGCNWIYPLQLMRIFQGTNC